MITRKIQMGLLYFFAVATIVFLFLLSAAHGAVREVFSDSGRAPEEIAAQLQAATGTLRVAMFSFTDTRLAAALTNAAARGVDVRVIADQSQASGNGSCIPMLEKALGSGHVLRTAGRHGAGIMHHKFCVIDGYTVLEGSYNWTFRADASNWEDLTIITDPAVAKSFLLEWSRISGVGLTAPPIADISAPVQSHARAYGWVKDKPEGWIFGRDAHFKTGPPVALPASCNLQSNCPPVYDQTTLESCTANASGAGWDFENFQQDGAFLTPSRLKIYYDARAKEGTIGQDAGAQLRDVLAVLCMPMGGVCPETMWPYIVSKFTQQPPAACYACGKTNYVLQAQSVAQDLATIKTVLAITRRPVIFGFTVYSSFESQAVAKSGIVPLPKRGEQILGGHAVLAVGYDDARQMVLVRNSWGIGWGLGGYFWLPYAYITNPRLASDFWTILRVQ